jgi:hypothetical protein
MGTTSDTEKLGAEDAVVPNEALVVDPLNSGAVEQLPEKWDADGRGPIVLQKGDPGPPDGGYGWVVVGYYLLEILM